MSNMPETSHLKRLLQPTTQQQQYPLVFATVSGSHLYGFPSPDSDYDVRGAHILPLEQVIGLHPFKETEECSEQQGDLQLDLVTHDVKKFFSLLLKRNGYVLEQLMSPLVVHTTPEHEELKAIAPTCMTRFHSKHYLGFAHQQWKEIAQAEVKRIKPLLYVYRVLLTGIHLMQHAQVEANLAILNEEARIAGVDDLIQQKRLKAEKGKLPNVDLQHHSATIQSLFLKLEDAADESHLPSSPSAHGALHDLLIRIRTK